MNIEGLLSMGFQYLSCITHAQLRLNAKLAVSSDLVSGYGENFLAWGFVMGIDILRDVKKGEWKDL